MLDTDLEDEFKGETVHTRPVVADNKHLTYLIVGTGFGGMCMAIKLQRRGETNFLMLERAQEAGGTWRDNSYPGAACDVPSHLYSFSFEQNPDWRTKYPEQPELYKYVQHVVHKYDLRRYMKFDHTVSEMRWLDDQQHWQVTTNHGVYTADYLITATGGLAHPKLPDITGVERFKGKVFHSSQWDHDYDLQGKEVAVIGTGASAIQFVPEVAKEVKKLTLFQRSANWILPRPDRKITRVEKWLFRYVPPVRWMYRQWIYWTHEVRVLGIVVNPKLIVAYKWLANWHRKRQVKDKALREKLTPDFQLGCRRILVTNDWYPAIVRDNVDLITTGIQEITEDAVIDSDGTQHKVDALILGTGFYSAENPIAEYTYGRNGVCLGDTWDKTGEEAYLGESVKNMPNFSMINGPNAALGHSSVILMIEGQARHIDKGLRWWKDNGKPVIEVKPEVVDKFNTKLQKGLSKSVWSSGCKSWYHNKHGKITTLWAGFTFTFILKAWRWKKGEYNATAKRLEQK